MARAVVIGYGNPLRTDDGVGWLAVEKLRTLLNTKQVTYITEHQLLPEMAEAIADSDVVVFLDASVEGSPGDITSQMVHPESHKRASFSHDLTPARLLGFTESLYDSAPYGVLFTVTGEDFGFGEKVTSLVEESLNKLVRQITKCLVTMLEVKQLV